MHLAVGFDQGTVTFAPVPRHRCATVRLRPHGLEVSVPEASPVVLPWDDAHYIDEWAQRDRPDVWTLTHWTSGRGGEIGVGVRMTGRYVDSTAEIRRRTMTRWRRWELAFERFGSVTWKAIPVLVSRTVFGPTTEVRSTLGALVAVLHARQEARDRLGDPRCCRRLVDDLRGHAVGPPPFAGPLGRDATDIAVAFRASGYRHEFGRPLSGDDVPPVDEVVAAVIERLEGNPYRSDRVNDVAAVEAFVRKHYSDVEPWPFAALTGDIDADR